MTSYVLAMQNRLKTKQSRKSTGLIRRGFKLTRLTAAAIPLFITTTNYNETADLTDDWMLLESQKVTGNLFGLNYIKQWTETKANQMIELWRNKNNKEKSSTKPVEKAETHSHRIKQSIKDKIPILQMPKCLSSPKLLREALIEIKQSIKDKIPIPQMPKCLSSPKLLREALIEISQMPKSQTRPRILLRTSIPNVIPRVWDNSVDQTSPHVKASIQDLEKGMGQRDGPYFHAMEPEIKRPPLERKLIEYMTGGKDEQSHLKQIRHLKLEHVVEQMRIPENLADFIKMFPRTSHLEVYKNIIRNQLEKGNLEDVAFVSQIEPKLIHWDGHYDFIHEAIHQLFLKPTPTNAKSVFILLLNSDPEDWNKKRFGAAISKSIRRIAELETKLECQEMKECAFRFASVVRNSHYNRHNILEEQSIFFYNTRIEAKLDAYMSGEHDEMPDEKESRHFRLGKLILEEIALTHASTWDGYTNIIRNKLKRGHLDDVALISEINPRLIHWCDKFAFSHEAIRQLEMAPTPGNAKAVATILANSGAEEWNAEKFGPNIYESKRRIAELQKKLQCKEMEECAEQFNRNLFLSSDAASF